MPNETDIHSLSAIVLMQLFRVRVCVCVCVKCVSWYGVWCADPEGDV